MSAFAWVQVAILSGCRGPHVTGSRVPCCQACMCTYLARPTVHRTFHQMDTPPSPDAQVQIVHILHDWLLNHTVWNDNTYTTLYTTLHTPHPYGMAHSYICGTWMPGAWCQIGYLTTLLDTFSPYIEQGQCLSSHQQWGNLG